MAPNFLLIITDQQRADHLGCYGNPILRTPAIDGIAAQGVAFNRFYVTCPICGPNRSTLMTGRPPSLHGVRHNGIPLPLEAVTFVDRLRESGYRTALVGKSHLQNMTDYPALVARRGKTEALRRAGGGRYDQEVITNWRGKPDFDLDYPFYGFDKVDLAVMHSDEVEGHYSQWLRERHPDPDSLRGRANALSNDGAELPQAWRTRMPEELYPTTYVAERTIARIHEFAGTRDQPFFLECSFPDPHHPFTPPGRYWDMYNPDNIPLPEAWNVDPDRIPPHVRHLYKERDEGTANRTSPALFAISEPEIRPLIALTYGMITMIDDAVARILQALEQTGQADNTVVIFTSDHGELMGDHQLLLKGPVHYEGVIRVPFIWRETAEQRVTGVRSGLAATIDLPNTILDRAGVEPFNGMLGISQRPVIAGEVASCRDAVLIEEEGQRKYMGFADRIRMRTLIEGQYRLSVYEGADWGELYDRKTDPLEMNNLWGRPEVAKIERHLLERMVREMVSWSETSPAPTALA